MTHRNSRRPRAPASSPSLVVSSRLLVASSLVATLLGAGGVALADVGNVARVDDAPAPARDGAAGVRDGTFLPETLSARIGDQRVMGYALGGYDTTAGQGGGLFQSVVEGALGNRVALRVGVDYTPVNTTFNPSVGLRVGILRQERFGVDFGVAAFYKNEGFAEARGEVELVVMLARRWDRLGLFANLAYGQGIDPGERDGEVRVGLLYQLRDRVQVGLDTRARFDLGEDTPQRELVSLDSRFDLLAGPVAAFSFGHFVVLAQAGAHVVTVGEQALGGFAAMGGFGTMF